MEFLGYTASLFMGITLGLMGGGGSILTVPIMVYLFSLSPSVATGYSLFVVGVTALVGSSMYIRKGEVDFKIGFIFAIPSMLGVQISRSLLLPQIPAVIYQWNNFILSKELLIMSFFAALMIAASYSMIKKKNEGKSSDMNPMMRMIVVAVQGLFVGLLAGFVGAGGGFLIIPALVLLARLPMKSAIGTSLMIIAIQSLFGFAGDVFRGVFINWSLLLTVSIIAMIGIILGSKWAHKVKEQKLKTAFGWFVLIMGSVIFIEQLSHF